MPPEEEKPLSERLSDLRRKIKRLPDHKRGKETWKQGWGVEASGEPPSLARHEYAYISTGSARNVIDLIQSSHVARN